MAALSLTITTAGLAALINAQNTGASAVVIDAIGLSPTEIVVTEATAAIPDEVKRLDAVAGQVVSDDTFHVSVYDQSADTYSVRTLGVYLSDGTLFAAYSQAAVIVEKASPSMVLLDADIRLSSALADNIEFSGGGWVNPPATEGVAGVLRLATAAEAKAGVNHSRAVTPLTLLAVLNDRFGAGAPSAFVKGLLTAASQAAMRLALGLKSAALKDEGAGNGLDADKLDGQEGAYYRAWDNLTGRPNSFPPSAHTHAAADVTEGVFSAARIPALAMTWITGLAAALATKADLTGAVFTGPVQAPSIRHRGGYFVMDPYSEAHDDGSQLRAYYDGVSSVLRLARNGTAGEPTRLYLGGRGYVWDETSFNGLVFRGLLTNENLNDVVASGIYQQTLNADATLARNYPTADFGAGTLEVIQVHSSWVVQRFTTYHNGRTYVRSGSSGPALSPWVNSGAASTYAAPGLIEMATNAEALEGTDQTRAINPYVLGLRITAAIAAIPAASSSTPGLVEMATAAEALAGTDGTTAICPATLAYVLNVRGVDPGAVLMHAASSAPTGWLICNGAAVSRATYADLFAEIGTTFGAGNGTTTFNLPDLRGEFVRGWDAGRGVDSGRAFGSAQGHMFESHSHTTVVGQSDGGGSGLYSSGDDYTSNQVRTVPTSAVGGVETRPRNVALLPIIKY